MKTKCDKCGASIFTDETAYEPGSTASVQCPRCKAVNTITIPGPVAVANSQVATQGPSSLQTNDGHNEALEIEKAKMVLKAKELEIEERKLAMSSQQASQVNQQMNSNQYPDAAPVSSKSKTTAGILGIFLGGFGAHKFYLGKTGMGILYLLFCWTYIPGIIGLIEGIIYLTKSDADFAREYPA